MFAEIQYYILDQRNVEVNGQYVPHQTVQVTYVDMRYTVRH
jgi:hypothetical protein